MNITIVSSKISQSAVSLMREMRANGNTIKYRRFNRTYGTPRSDVTINWGSGNSRADSPTTYNPPSAVNQAADKLSCFRTWDLWNTPNILEWDTDREVAVNWIRQGHRVYCRSVLRGNSGEGIVVARTVDELIDAPLYTKGVDIAHEFRFHIVKGVVIDAIRKAYSRDTPDDERNPDIRNHAAGTIFVRGSVSLDNALQNTALIGDVTNAVQVLGLDFGAVDVILDHDGNHHIVEVNTACGLEGTTLTRYARAMTQMVNQEPVQGLEYQPTVSLEELQQNIDNELQLNQEDNTMTTSSYQIDQAIRFNPAHATVIQSLTVGNVYLVTRVTSQYVYIRCDSGSIRPYNPSYFTLATLEAPVAPVAPVANELVGVLDTLFPEDMAPQSPERAALLNDGTSVNPTGTALYIGSSNHCDSDIEVEIVDVWVGEESKDFFLGFYIGEDLYHFIASDFARGEINYDELPEYRNGLDDSSPSALDINGKKIRIGGKVQVKAGAGGHGLTVGSLGTVTSILYGVLTLEDGSCINGERVKGITESVYNTLVAEEAILQTQSVITFTIEGDTYSVPSRDLGDLRQALLNFTV